MAAKRILFVCTGNICRSAMAEHLLRHIAQSQKLDLEVGSCGVAAEGYYEVPAVVRRLLGEKGVLPFEHRPRLLTREILRAPDIVLVMTEAHLEHIGELYPEFCSKVHLFCAYAGLGELDVADPMGRPDEDFVACLRTIERGLAAMIAADFRRGG